MSKDNNAKLNELICSDCGQYESECKCDKLFHNYPVFTPPTDEGLKEQITDILLHRTIFTGSKHSANLVTDEILTLLQQVIERDYVKLAWLKENNIIAGMTGKPDHLGLMISAEKWQSQAGGKSDEFHRLGT